MVGWQAAACHIWQVLFAVMHGENMPVLVVVGLVNFWFTWISASLVMRRHYREHKRVQRDALVRAAGFIGTDQEASPEAVMAAKEV